MSKEAKNLIRNLITPKSKKRLIIPKIKQHPFFKGINWNHAENGKLSNRPKVAMRHPESADFDEISPDSEDEDFEHEYMDMKNGEFQCEFDTDDAASQ